MKTVALALCLLLCQAQASAASRADRCDLSALVHAAAQVAHARGLPQPQAVAAILDDLTQGPVVFGPHKDLRAYVKAVVQVEYQHPSTPRQRYAALYTECMQ
jgi:hypothetical protein